MKNLIALMVVLLSGCAGQAVYEAEPIVTGDGSVICCKVTVNNSKDVDSVEVEFEKTKDGGVKLKVKQKGIKTNAAVAAENQGKLLDAITSIIPKG